jgi:predicted transcriptional regulator
MRTALVQLLPRMARLSSADAPTVVRDQISNVEPRSMQETARLVVFVYSDVNRLVHRKIILGVAAMRLHIGH